MVALARSQLRDPTWPLTAAAAAVGAILIAFAIQNLTLHDMDAYWNAAVRIREGGPIYQATTNLHQGDLYRYAPWFAFVWVPLTLLPYPVVQAGWFALLVAASLWVSVSVYRTAPALAFVGGPLLLWTAAYGNVQPLMVAGLYFGLERRSGPLWLALAASLKAAPILLVLVYLGRREWTKAVVTVAVTAALVAPMLWLPGYTSNPGLTLSLYGWAPPLYVGVALFAAGLAVLLARTRWAWLAGSFAVVAALPRLLLYDFSFLLLSRAAEEVSHGLHVRRTSRRLRPADQETHPVAGGGERLGA